MPHIQAWICDFDIDRYLVLVIPPSPLSHLPYPVARFLGYRDRPRSHLCQPLVWLWSFIGAFCGVALIEGVYRTSPALRDFHPPVVIGSFGAAAILEYGSIESPLAQPRNLVFSHAFASVIAVSITKLFAHLPPARFQDLRWLAGALAVATSSAVMNITKTVHPPAGAMALLAATSPDVSSLGWNLVPLVMVGAALMLGSALVINNIQRQFPSYWMTPTDTREARRRLKGVTGGESDEEKQRGQADSDGNAQRQRNERVLSKGQGLFTGRRDIIISPAAVAFPDWMEMSDIEKETLDTLRLRLAGEYPGSSDGTSTSSNTADVDKESP